MITKEEIEEINNNKEDWEQGIYVEPWGIDQNEKRPVIYQRIETGGASGGSCCGTEAEAYTNHDVSEKMNNWSLLDDVLTRFATNITYLQYKKLLSTLVKDNEKTEYEYYGNYTDYFIRWIVVEELFEYLEKNNIH